jgi:alditol oxidase
MGSLVNWAGNVRFQTTTLHRPQSVAQLQRLVAGSARIRALGTAHSFSRIADTTGDLVSVASLPPVVELDIAGAAVKVSAGLRYSDIAPRLNAAGHALANLASLPHISVAGAVASGTHGSGDANPGLAAAVSELELVTADGDLVTVRRESDAARFPGLVVALGACGVVTALTLATVPAFAVRQWVYEDIPFSAVSGQFGEITAAGYSVSMFTDWRRPRMTQTWLKHSGAAAKPPPASWLGGQLARADLHPVAGMPAANCTPQLGQPGPWHERLPHFRAEFIPSSGAELQSEFLLSREHAVAALAALDSVATGLAPVVQVSEIRTVAADDLWLSPCYQRDSVAFHFTWVPDAQAVAPALASVEEVLAPFEPRPHWGKLTGMSPAVVAGRYPKLDDFRRLVAEFDGRGTFRNDVVNAYLQPTG